MKGEALERLQKAGQVCLFLAVLLPPLVFYRRTLDVFNLVKLTTLWIFGISALLLWFAWAAESGIWLPRIRIGVAAAAFIVAVALSTAFSINPTTSLVGIYHRYGGLIPALLYVAIFFATVGLHWRRPEGLRRLAWAFGIASTLISVYVVIQAAGLDWIRWNTASGRAPSSPIGTLGNSNFAGGYLGITVPFLVFLAADRGDRWNWALLGATGFVMGAIFLTQSRGGLIAAGIGIIAMGIAYRDRLPKSVRWAGAGGVALVSILALVFVVLPGLKQTPTADREEGLLRTDTLRARGSYWGAAARNFLDHPMVGTGPDTFGEVFPRYRAAEEAAVFGENLADKPHNILFEHASNAGALGLISYVFLIGLALRSGYRVARIEGPERLLSLAFLGALAAYLAQGVLSIDVPPLAATGWVAIGGIAALGDPASVEARGGKDRRLRKGKSRRSVHSILIATLLAALFIGSFPVRADAELSMARRKAEAKRPPAELARHHLNSIRLNPLEPQYEAHYGRFAELEGSKRLPPGVRRRWFRLAVDQYQKAHRALPGNIPIMAALANTYARWGAVDVGRFRDAERWWKRILSLDRNNSSAKLSYSRTLLAWSVATSDESIRQRAVGLTDEVAAIKLPLGVLWVDIASNYMAMGLHDKARGALAEALLSFPDSKEAKQILERLKSISEAGK